jgi:hypothetical protein
MQIVEPTLVVETSDNDRHYYRFSVGDGAFRRLHLRVITDISTGRVRTVHFMRTPGPDGRVVFIDPNWRG